MQLMIILDGTVVTVALPTIQGDLAFCQTALTLLIRGHEELEVEDNPVTGREVTGSITFAISALTASLLAALVPGVRFYSL